MKDRKLVQSLFEKTGTSGGARETMFSLSNRNDEHGTWWISTVALPHNEYCHLQREY